MTINLDHAHKQWMKRSPDESFDSLEDLYRFTHLHKCNSAVSSTYLSNLRVETTPHGSLLLNGNTRPAGMTNWSFGQLASHIGAPASYLRSVSPDLAKSCIQYGLDNTNKNCQTLQRTELLESGASIRSIAAFTGINYGRIWDESVVRKLLEATQGSSWKTPAELSDAHESGGTGLYASDRDMFVFMVNEEHSVEVDGAKLGRGFFCWNSETGNSTFGLTTFLYNYVCANHIVWGAEHVNEINIYHRNHADYYFNGRAVPTLEKFVRDSSLGKEIKTMVKATRARELGDDLENVIKRLSPGRFTKSEIENAWSAAEDQNENPRSVWGLVQGLTSIAQDIPFQDKRVNLERRAGKLLDIAAN